MIDRRFNRKLLVSVFNGGEAREAVLGGGRIIDSEDPASALGNISPSHIMDISDAVLEYSRDGEVMLSTNIGEDQLLFDRTEHGLAIQKSPYEIAGKAAQAAIGVACAMGTRVFPVNLVKVGVDGMRAELVVDVLREVVTTLNRTEEFSHSQVMSVLFAQHLTAWDERKTDDRVRDVLVGLREFFPVERGAEDSFDLKQHAVGTLRNESGDVLFEDESAVTLSALKEHGVLPAWAKTSTVRLNELFEHDTFFDVARSKSRRTSAEVIQSMVEATREAGADSIMLDTRIQSKVARICAVDTSSAGLIDINQYDVNSGGMARQGILSLDLIQTFVRLCHANNVQANLAGSVQSYQAQQVWLEVPDLDQISTRGASSGVALDPLTGQPAAADTRQHRVIRESLVRGLAPPEQGGCLNIPARVWDNPDARNDVLSLCERLQRKRAEQRLPDLKAFSIDPAGEPSPIPF